MSYLMTNQTHCGGKADHLGLLGRLGCNVPDWFCLRYEYFQEHKERSLSSADWEMLQHLGQLGVPTNLHVLASLAKGIKEQITGAGPTPELRSKIQQGVAALGGFPIVVRSSASVEDGSAASFAGQFTTHLYINDVHAALEAVLDVWSSAFSLSSILYRVRTGMLDREVLMGVVLQKMVMGDVSGVLFTRDVLGRELHDMRIAATWGLGQGVVDGSISHDELTCNSEGVVREYRVADKTQIVLPDRDTGRGTHLAPVDNSLRTARCLDDCKVLRLAALGRLLRTELSCDQDVEWTFSGDHLFALQSRPITPGSFAAPSR